MIKYNKQYDRCTMFLLDVVKSMYEGTEGTLDVIMIS